MILDILNTVFQKNQFNSYGEDFAQNVVNQEEEEKREGNLKILTLCNANDEETGGVVWFPPAKQFSKHRRIYFTETPIYTDMRE